MIVVQKRSGKRHLVHPDGIATRCGRIIRPRNWRWTRARVADCDRCYESLAAELTREVRRGQ